ncbi:hypothetical protein ACKXGF_04960 [Alkalibacillus sp. S2W]|uniref:hypothetical protein n=1 Tax=Alkalibacillus sp. S2W TaxID=3386553 RepID=UPI00398D253F
MDQRMNKDVIEHARAISNWLRHSANPYVSIEITDADVKVTSVEESVPTTEVEKS